MTEFTINSKEEFLKVEDEPDLMRDAVSGAIVNTNRTAYDRAVTRAKAAQEQRDGLRNATREINNIKCEMHEIKDMLTILLDRK